jgi:hypothetical protein
MTAAWCVAARASNSKSCCSKSGGRIPKHVTVAEHSLPRAGACLLHLILLTLTATSSWSRAGPRLPAQAAGSTPLARGGGALPVAAALPAGSPRYLVVCLARALLHCRLAACDGAGLQPAAAPLRAERHAVTAARRVAGRPALGQVSGHHATDLLPFVGRKTPQLAPTLLRFQWRGCWCRVAAARRLARALASASLVDDPVSYRFWLTCAQDPLETIAARVGALVHGPAVVSAGVIA